MEPIRVLIADDHDLVRAGIKAILNQSPDIEVVGEAGDGRETLRLVEELDPDILLLDVSMPEMNGLEVAAKLQRSGSRTRVLFLSMHANEHYAVQALKLGASGYLLKRATTGELELAIRCAQRGEIFLSPALSSKVLTDYVVRPKKDPKTGSAVDPYESLTSRQREILQLIVEGYSTKEIAKKIGITYNTASVHRSNLMDRLDIHDLASLVRYAIEAGIVTSDSKP
ncbi:MAG: response regulator transcription factor [Syntrophorhabdales bacterium]|jgi:DNA-binding NarL/FixJ family response regulator